VASVIKKPSSRYFFACFRDKTGRQRRLSTGQTDRKKALSIALEWETVGRKLRKASHVRETTNRLIREFYGEETPNVTVREFCAS
jgi:hypothetical protein